MSNNAGNIINPEFDMVGDALYKSLKSGGFNFLIDFKELLFDPKTDKIGKGGYGEVF
jgi:hypothetical protein